MVERTAPKIRLRCFETGDESWIYAYEPESRQQSTVWVLQDEPNPSKVARTLSTSKQMIACLFRKIGHLVIVPLEKCRAVNSEWYTTICLSVVFQEIRKTYRRSLITLHHDNASSHTLAQTTTFLSTQNSGLMSHPPYSPDTEWLLFIPVRKKKRGQRFSISEEAVDSFRMHVSTIFQSEWQKCFDNWFKRMYRS